MMGGGNSRSEKGSTCRSDEQLKKILTGASTREARGFARLGIPQRPPSRDALLTNSRNKEKRRIHSIGYSQIDRSTLLHSFPLCVKMYPDRNTPGFFIPPIYGHHIPARPMSPPTSDTDFPPDDADDADSAYGGDSFIGDETKTLSSFITNYRYEYGRRYHAYRDGAYWVRSLLLKRWSNTGGSGPCSYSH